ncbi:MAG: hypothetical protein RKO66_05420 [Candidatus Contendobacter sp.]|nr:hypothetical protein [Candidatus Contendobacter sp.]MDS4058225.1 hypothetical protein [Candidatus Contendobacter sp.]
MAKVKGPLFSLAASGSFRGMEFRTGGGETTVAAPREIQAQRRPAQVAQNNRFRNALEAWNGLDAEAKAAWIAGAVGTGMSGYKRFISEYMMQNIIPPNIPLMP